MKWSEIHWTRHDILPSRTARISCGVYEISIIEEIGEPGLYELAVLHKGDLCQLPGIHAMTDDWGDDVLRYQTREECIAVVRKMEYITGKEPENANSG